MREKKKKMMEAGRGVERGKVNQEERQEDAITDTQGLERESRIGAGGGEGDGRGRVRMYRGANRRAGGIGMLRERCFSRATALVPAS